MEPKREGHAGDFRRLTQPAVQRLRAPASGGRFAAWSAWLVAVASRVAGVRGAVAVQQPRHPPLDVAAADRFPGCPTVVIRRRMTRKTAPAAAAKPECPLAEFRPAAYYRPRKGRSPARRCACPRVAALRRRHVRRPRRPAPYGSDFPPPASGPVCGALRPPACRPVYRPDLVADERAFRAGVSSEGEEPRRPPRCTRESRTGRC